MKIHISLVLIGILSWVSTTGAQSDSEALRHAVETSGHPSSGPSDVAVTIVEFGDFECPNCGGLFPTLQRIKQDYSSQVRFVFRQLPLRQAHPHAQKAAEASLCAYEQGHFWEFHDSMFENQHDLTVRALKRRAVEFGLDTDVFDRCLDSGRQAARIDADIDAAIEAGVTGTPTMYINGRKLVGNRGYEAIVEVIEDELARLER